MMSAGIALLLVTVTAPGVSEADWQCMAAAVNQYEIIGITLRIKQQPIIVIGPLSWSGKTKDLDEVTYSVAQAYNKNMRENPNDLVAFLLETRPDGDDHTDRLASDVLRIEVSEDLTTANDRQWYRWMNRWGCHGRICELRDPHTYDIWMGKGPQVYINWDCSRPPLQVNTHQCSGPGRYDVTEEDRVVFTWQSKHGILLLSCAEENCSNCE